ncbi:MORC family CW-type zinc finger protein 1 [Microcaecilia unicolor]|uniref:MORC family CW-type zinc finger protein 1 n=1 Tax=Microcaecilia unicolor TaxID=1415580 RepID=A0A6P7Y7E8_9AMPH|nr:MORC family CW-type zinc finger protein 1 [Microcaecilia unicolor]
MDNARDAGATRLDIFAVDSAKLQGGFMLCFLDDGCGMSPKEAVDLIYLGRSAKHTSGSRLIGQYGNGLKSGAMRIGKDFILFTKKEDTMTCLLFSQTFCESEGLLEMIVPISSWTRGTREALVDDLEKYSLQISIMCKYSPFKTEEELIRQFDTIYAKQGTMVIIYNLKLTVSGEPELDIRTDASDILLAEMMDYKREREHWSLRAYSSILYFDPQMKIFIQTARVETKLLLYSLYRPRMYPYVTSSIKVLAKQELVKAESAVSSAEERAEKAKYKLNRLENTLDNISEADVYHAQVALQDALENVKRKYAILEEKQRELKRPREFHLIFGVNIENRSQDGMFLYNNSRLIRMYEKTGWQLHHDSYTGAGVMGLVNIPSEYMAPTLNKQSFLNVKEYNHLRRIMGHFLIQYWKDSGIYHKGAFQFWNEFGYLGGVGKWFEVPSDAVQYKRRRSLEIPAMIQCDLCLKWRTLPLFTDANRRHQRSIWTCAENPNPTENSCDKPERLPSIPLGTLSKAPMSVNEQEKILLASIQRHQQKLEALQLKKAHIIQPHTITQYPAESSKTLLQKARRKSFRRNLCLRENIRREPAAPSASLQIGKQPKVIMQIPEKHKISVVAPCRKVQKWQVSTTDAQELSRVFQGLPAKISKQTGAEGQPEIICLDDETEDNDPRLDETEDNDPEIICVMLDDDIIEDSLRHKDNSKCAVNYEESQNLEADKCISAGRMEIVKTEKSISAANTPGSLTFEGIYEATMKVSVPRQADPQFDVKTAEKMIARIKEIMLHFLPDYKLPKELLQDMDEEAIASLSPSEDCLEELNKRIMALCSRQVMMAYFSQYEEVFKEKIRTAALCSSKAMELNQLKQSQCEADIKAAEWKLETLRMKAEKLFKQLHLKEYAAGHHSVHPITDFILQNIPDELDQIDACIEDTLTQLDLG